MPFSVRSSGAILNWNVFQSGREFLLISGFSSSDVKLIVNWPQLPALVRGGSKPH